MSPVMLSTVSGEFADPRAEAKFRDACLAESLRQSRGLLFCSSLFNTLFLATDARFYGEPHFWIAVPARLGLVIASLICLFIVLPRVRNPAALTRLLVAWEVAASVAVALLVSSHSELAFFAMILLPSIFYLAAPTPFAVTASMGLFCTSLLLTGFLWRGTPPTGTSGGIVIAMLMLNAALMLVLTKNNRLRRLEWSATQAERRVKEELAASRQNLEKIFMAVPIPLVVTQRQSGRLLRANHAAVRFYGGEEALRGLKETPTAYLDPERRKLLLSELATKGYADAFETRIVMPDGGERDLLLASTLITLDGQDCMITGGVDVTAQRALQTRLEELATLDPLTRVFNRAAFCEVGRREIVRARRERTRICAVMIDLDYFKLINDAFGHAAGDLTLTSFANLCRSHLRAQDCLGRLGGEEFALILPNTTRDDALDIAERLRLAAENMKVDDSQPGLRVTISVGISEIDTELEDDLSSALARADLALYAAKMRGRNKVVEASEAEDFENDQADNARPIISAKA